jgi:hypothetical protein
VVFGSQAAAVLAACMIATRKDPMRTVIVLGTAFTITGLQLGSLSPLLFAGAVFMWILRDRPLAFALIAAPVIASKLFLAPLLVWPLLAGRPRAFAYAAASTTALLAVGFALGPLSLPDYVQMLSQLSAHEGAAGMGLVSAMRTVGLAAATAQAAAIVLALFVLAGAYLHFRRSRDERVVFCAAIIASLIITPVLWGHYFVLLPAALLVMNAGRRWLVVLALASWVIAPPHGLHLSRLTEPVLGRVTGHGPWMAATLTALVFVYAATVRRRTANA